MKQLGSAVAAILLGLAVVGSLTLIVAVSPDIQEWILETSSPEIRRADQEYFVPRVAGYLRTGDRILLADLTAKEQRHLADVRRLLGWVLGATIIGIVGTVRLRPTLAARRWTPVALVLFGLGVEFAFESVFLRFHELAFTNLDWYLPDDEFLLTWIYPEPFFRSAWTHIAVGSALTLAFFCLRRVE